MIFYATGKSGFDQVLLPDEEEGGGLHVLTSVLPNDLTVSTSASWTSALSLEGVRANTTYNFRLCFAGRATNGTTLSWELSRTDLSDAVLSYERIISGDSYSQGFRSLGLAGTGLNQSDVRSDILIGQLVTGAATGSILYRFQQTSSGSATLEGGSFMQLAEVPPEE